MKKLGDKKSRVKPEKWHAYVATPAYDGKVDCDFAQSLAEASFCAPLYHVYMTAGVMGNGAFIDLARNIFVKMFLDDFKDCTHLFFIDADLKFSPNAFIGLMRSGLPICAGVYRRRQEPEDYPCKFSEHPEMGGLWVENEWIMCDRVPTGFLCISRKVLEEMAADAPKLSVAGQEGSVPRLFYTKNEQLDDGTMNFVGEDYCFCDDVVKRYGKIPVWPDIDFVHGSYPGNLLKFLKKEIEKTEQATSSAA